MDIIINKDKVTHIKIFKETSEKYYWLPEKVTFNFFGLFKNKYVEGFYYRGKYETYSEIYSKDEMEKKFTHHFIKDGCIYRKPHIELCMNNVILDTKYFEEYDSINDYIIEHFDDPKYLIIRKR